MTDIKGLMPNLSAKFLNIICFKIKINYFIFKIKELIL